MNEIKNQFISLTVCLMAFTGQSQTDEIQKFYNNQTSPFLSATSEVLLIENIPLERLYGEKEYVICPTIENVDLYNSRIHSKDDTVTGENKSFFQFIEVEVNPTSRNLLDTKGIQIPSFIHDKILVYLPKIDIEDLEKAAIHYTLRSDYGVKESSSSVMDEKEEKSLIYSEGFETHSLPSSEFNTSIGTLNCGWKDVSCANYGGSWSAWCAGNGAGCNTLCSSYGNNMGASFSNKYYVNISSYIDLWFKFYIYLDLYDIGSNDELSRYYDLGSGSWTLSASSYTSSSSLDEAGWTQQTFFYSGSHSNFAYKFYFYSNSVGTSTGVYIDDIEITGTYNNTSGLDEHQISEVKIFPNPTHDFITLSVEKQLLGQPYSIFDNVGRIVSIGKLNSTQSTVDLTSFENGIYFIQVGDNTKRIKIVKL
jgi:hypothetical protein